MSRTPVRLRSLPIPPLVLALGVIALILLVAPEPALAGPGGAFVKFVAKSWWAKLGLILLAVIFLPIIAWVYFVEWRNVRATKRHLAELAEEFPEFDWSENEGMFRRVVSEVYAAWSTGDLGSVRHYFDPRYFESQQDLIERWDEEGKRNVIRFDGIDKLLPLRVEVETETSFSVQYLMVKGSGVDYLERQSDGKVLKGSKKHDELETIWCFAFIEGAWRIAGIDDGAESLAITGRPPLLDPSFRRALFGAPSELALPQAPEHVATSELEDADEAVSEREERRG